MTTEAPRIVTNAIESTLVNVQIKNENPIKEDKNETLDQAENSFPVDKVQMAGSLVTSPQRSAVLSCSSANLSTDHDVINKVLNPEMSFITLKLNTLDIGFFCSVVRFWKRFCYLTYTRFSEDQACIQDFRTYATQMIRMMETRSNYLPYSPAMKNERIDAVCMEETQRMCEEILSTVEPGRLRVIANNFVHLTKVLPIFLSHSHEGKSMTEIFEYLGFGDEFIPFKRMLPQCVFWNLKLPSFLTTSLFHSPWAQTLEQEQFFMRTAENFKVN